MTSPIEALLLEYYEARGSEIPEFDAPHLRREVDELEEALDRYSLDDPSPVHDEIADVVLGAAVAAYQNGVTVEECIRGKIARDVGRGQVVH